MADELDNSQEKDTLKDKIQEMADKLSITGQQFQNVGGNIVSMVETLKELSSTIEEIKEVKQVIKENTQVNKQKIERERVSPSSIHVKSSNQVNKEAEKVSEGFTETLHKNLVKSQEEIIKAKRETYGNSKWSRNYLGRAANNLSQLGLRGFESFSWDSSDYNKFAGIREGQLKEGKFKEAFRTQSWLDFYNAKKSSNNLMFAYHAAKGLYHGARGGALGGGVIGFGASAIGGIALVGAMAALTATIKQVGLIIKENIKAMAGGNFADARQAAAAGGRMEMWGRGMGITTGNYNAYRSVMRRLGNRDDQAIAQQLGAMTRSGIWGSNGMDAISAAISKQAIRSRMGIDIKDDFIARLYRSTQANQDGMFRNRSGQFTLNGLMFGSAAITRRSMTKFGAQLGMDETLAIVEQLTQGLLGMNNSVEKVMAGIDRFASSITHGKITTEEFLSMFKGVNEGMSQQARMNVLAVDPRGQGNILERDYDYLARTRSAEGRINNWAYVSRVVLDFVNKNVGGNYKEKTSIMNRDGGILDIFGLSALKNNPHVLSLLSEASKGDKGATETLQRAFETEKDIMTRQANTLDAIRNPVEHMRDALFAMVGVRGSDWSKADSAKKSYISYKMGLTDEQKADFNKAYDASELESKRSVGKDVFEAMMESFFDKMTPQMQGFMDALYRNATATDNLRKSNSNGKKALG